MMAFGGRDDGLFRGAIMESGAPTTAMYQPSGSDYSNSSFQWMVGTSGCSNASEPLDCVRQLPFPDLYKALAPAPNNPYFFPTIDGDFIRESAAQQLLEEAYVKVPTIIGHNDDEGAFLSASASNCSTDNETQTYIEGNSTIDSPF